ncbi:MAG: rRNA maturation RNase YbeY [Candidatus Omnitrophica bacterium]|nr:rRNA maturation RNase YbeY [Candidatus Omnitrophota bacterium]MDD5237737.1 rRNA maturation RNase YbeY [Candidatus Omnitrophota bacterium]
MKITIKDFQKKIPVNPKRIKKTILNILSKEAIKKSGEITVCFVNDRNIKKLNLRYRGRNQATDVLAFDLSEPKSQRIFGDIAISTDAAVRGAKIYKTNVFYELNLYVAHGILHILGYSDHTTKEKGLMHKKEEEYVHT